jgi:hypothetical protein
MTAYRTSDTSGAAVTAAARAAKAQRQAVLQHVRAQRAAAYKRTVADWMNEGLFIRTSELKERYQSVKRSLVGNKLSL